MICFGAVCTDWHVYIILTYMARVQLMRMPTKWLIGFMGPKSPNGSLCTQPKQCQSGHKAGNKMIERKQKQHKWQLLEIESFARGFFYTLSTALICLLLQFIQLKWFLRDKMRFGKDYLSLFEWKLINQTELLANFKSQMQIILQF